MTNKLFSARFIFITSAILLAALSRVFPHFDNFTPIAAMALFGGVYFSDKRLAFIVPLVAMIISDVILELTTGWGFHNTIVYVYVAFILTAAIGLIVRKNTNVQTVLGASVISSLLFFIITNFGVWAASGGVGGAPGLATTYVLGVPFFAPTLLGDVFYNTILFGAFYLAQRRIPALIK
ncbi:MAG TPA: DUF6580 family putative transport protein [Bacteroidia bacterium]|nr:DUF6580 family putative transport protein [Bacteroidia bacterium]